MQGLANSSPTLQSPAEYAFHTYSTAQLADLRLHARLLDVAATLAAKPRDSLPQASDGRYHAKALYRFVENERVTVKQLTSPVARATAKACAGQSVVLSIQDTSTLSFPNAHATKDLGPINDSDKQGILLHTALAVDDQGIAIGALDIQLWCRDPEQRGSRHERYDHAIEGKESSKWLNGMAGARNVLNQLSLAQRPRLIHIFDREADIHEVFQDILEHDEGAVIRCTQDRCVKVATQQTRAHGAVRHSRLRATFQCTAPRKHNQTERIAIVQVRAIHAVINPPKRHKHHQQRTPLALNLVEVWEAAPPTGIEALHWLLWTTEPIDTLEQVSRVVEYYRKRWRIEDMHKTLKSGCQVEQLQLETAERLMKVVALYLPIAIKILRLRDWARQEPDLPCTVVLSPVEWLTLWAYMNERPAEPATPVPSLRQAVLWIGRLGGHLNRKSDGMPGVKTLWLGWRDLQLMVTCLRRLRRAPT